MSQKLRRLFERKCDHHNKCLSALRYYVCVCFEQFGLTKKLFQSFSVIFHRSALPRDSYEHFNMGMNGNIYALPFNTTKLIRSKHRKSKGGGHNFASGMRVG